MNATHTLEDDFGRRTIFTGELLVEETSDTSDGRKPQWLEVDVWRTEGGSYVVRRTTRYRVRHSHSRCPRAEGYDLDDATPEDTYLCPNCNKNGVLSGGLRQLPRITVDAYRTPQELIESFKQPGGGYSNLARAILAEVSDQDDEVHEAWNIVVVP